MKFVFAIVLGGTVAGTLDILSAFTTWVPRGVTEMRILQFIASGVFGSKSFSGGWATAAAGLGVHYCLALTMAAVFVITSIRVTILRKSPWIVGPIYGVALYIAMTFVLVPLSAVNPDQWHPHVGWPMIAALMTHCLFVGLPIALISRDYVPPSR